MTAPGYRKPQRRLTARLGRAIGIVLAGGLLCLALSPLEIGGGDSDEIARMACGCHMSNVFYLPALILLACTVNRKARWIEADVMSEILIPAGDGASFRIWR